MFWWLPDLDDEDIKGQRSKSGRKARASRGLRNRPLPDKTLLKQRDGKLKDRRATKMKEEKGRGEMEEGEEAAEDERDENTAEKKRILEAKKKKKKTKG